MVEAFSIAVIYAAVTTSTNARSTLRTTQGMRGVGRRRTQINRSGHWFPATIEIAHGQVAGISLLRRWRSEVV
jgi:hypothetical protein